MATAGPQKRRPYAIGLGYGFSDTRMIFFDAGRYRFRQSAYSLSFVTVLRSGLVLGGGIGAHMGGTIDGLYGAPTGVWRIRPGVLWSLTIGRRFFGTKPAIPYFLVVGTASGSSTSTVRDVDGARAGLHAFDVKADLSVGWTIGGAWSPYVALRGFGGPALWRGVEDQRDQRIIGGDLYHVSLALGFNLDIVGRVGAWFDAAVLGMRGLGAGVSVRF